MLDLLKFILEPLLTKLVTLLPKEYQQEAISKLIDLLEVWSKKGIDAFIDWIENLVIKSPNVIDDAIILRFCIVIRGILGVPDEDEILFAKEAIKGIDRWKDLTYVSSLNLPEELSQLRNKMVYREKIKEEPPNLNPTDDFKYLMEIGGFDYYTLNN